MPLLTENSFIRDTYEVERFLGEGAFAEVYRVKHRFLGRQAMKVFKQRGMTLSEIEECVGEAVLLSRIGHPNIVRVFDANVLETKDGFLGYFTMENVAGGTLENFWKSYGNRLVPIKTVIDIVKQICRGISIAHHQNPPVIHRDIKPQNILIGYEADGLRVRVSDFGLAKNVNPLTLLATAVGTLDFKPPEAFIEIKGDSTAADVWGIGVTLYLLLTDRLPFKKNARKYLAWESAEVAYKIIKPASEINPDANEKLDKIIQKTLEIDAARRFQNADELLFALEEWNNVSVAKEKIPERDAHEKNIPIDYISSSSKIKAEEIVTEAFNLKREGRLAEAADALEEAFNKFQGLREKYATQVELWRKGISM